MTKYQYRAKKGPEEIVEGRLDARDKAEAIDKINQMGYIPVRVDEIGPAASARPSLNRPGTRIRTRDITVFTRQLASLLRSGVPILDALQIISEQCENPSLNTIISEIHNDIKGGVGFSSALEAYPKVFSNLYISVIRTGENSGNLPEALLRVAHYRAKQEEMLSRFRMAMAYPLLMAAVGIATVVFMFTFVMPRLMGIFSSMGQELPLPTRIVMYVSTRLSQWQSWFWIILLLIFAVLIIKRESGTRAGRISLSLFKLHLPLYGTFTLRVELARFCRTMELLIRSGVPILKSIEFTLPVLGNEIIKEKLGYGYAQLEHGGSFGKTLKESKLIPAFMSNLVIIGEESGKLHDALAEIADTYERETEEAMRIMASLLEPMMILGVGLIVGFIVVAMLLPIFEINVMAR